MTKWMSLVCASLLLFAFTACSRSGKVVANIGKDKISVKMLEERLHDAPPVYQTYLNTEAGKKQFLDLLVRERLVLEAARQAGVQSRQEYRKSLTEFKKDQDRRLKEYQDSLMMEMFVRELYDKEINPNDQEIEAYYKEHEKEYSKPVAVKAQHILVQSKEEAEKVLARINAGEDFSKLAKEVSTDHISAKNGGEIGPFRKGQLVPDFENAVFPLKIGQVSGIVKTEYGFHIIKKLAEQSLPSMAPEQAKAEIRTYLQKAKFDAWLEKAKVKYGVKVDYSVLANVTAQPSAQVPGLPQGNPAAAPQQTETAAPGK